MTDCHRAANLVAAENSVDRSRTDNDAAFLRVNVDLDTAQPAATAVPPIVDHNLADRY